MKTIKTLAIFNALSLTVHIALAYYTQFKKFNSFTVSEISSNYETIFTPAGFTFAIWGIIYTALGIFCLYHLFTAFKKDSTHDANVDIHRIGLFFTLVNLASAAWLLAWTNNKISISVGLIFLQLICLVIIHTRLRLYNRQSTAARKIFTQIPLSIYLGWICIATIANNSSWLTGIGWDGWGLSQTQWALVMVSIAVILAILMIIIRHNIYFSLVIAWALFGIISKLEIKNEAAYDTVINTAWLGFGVIIVSALVHIFNNRHQNKKSHFPEAPVSLK